MSELDVRIVNLEPMRVASFHAYGDSPENEAGKKLMAWAKPRGLLDTPSEYRIFGFDNPEPMPGSPNHGYEFNITIGPDIEPESDVKIKEFPGGLYAVARCEVQGGGFEVIGETWERLAAWREGSSQYRDVGRQCLEEHIGPFEVSDSFTLDLFLPISD